MAIRNETAPQDDGKILVDVRDLRKTYANGRFVAVDGVSLEFRTNEIVALVGPSGCGKTTVLRMIAGLEPPSSGSLRMNGHDITGPGPERGMIFQAYTSFPWLTAQQNVEYSMKLLGVGKEERADRARQLLRLVRLERFAGTYPAALSGGMRQRVAIARTLAQNPDLLLMDEPFGALDAQVRWEMQELMVELIERDKKTVILVTHDIQEAIYLADRIVFFSAHPGRIKADLRLEFKNGRRFLHKEGILTEPGYAAMEKLLFQMMREELKHAA